MKFTSLFKRKLTPIIDKDIARFQDKQLSNIITNKLQESDFKKIMKHLNNKDIFTNECSLWLGCVCNKDKKSKGIYINFYYNRKKHSLHRLIYQNFKNNKLNDKTYLLHTCNNKLCINPNHLIEKKQNEQPHKDMFKMDFNISF